MPGIAAGKHRRNTAARAWAFRLSGHRRDWAEQASLYCPG